MTPNIRPKVLLPKYFHGVYKIMKTVKNFAQNGYLKAMIYNWIGIYAWNLFNNLILLNNSTPLRGFDGSYFANLLEYVLV